MTTALISTVDAAAAGVAAGAQDLVKVYGTGDAAVRALDGVSVDSRPAASPP